MLMLVLSSKISAYRKLISGGNTSSLCTLNDEKYSLAPKWSWWANGQSSHPHTLPYWVYYSKYNIPSVVQLRSPQCQTTSQMNMYVIQRDEHVMTALFITTTDHSHACSQHIFVISQVYLFRYKEFIYVCVLYDFIQLCMTCCYEHLCTKN